MDILADTNILLRRIDRRALHHRQTREAIRRLRSDGHRLYVTSQNLVEFWSVCTRPIQSNGLGLAPGLTERILARIEQAVIRLPDSDRVFSEWRKLVAMYAVSGRSTHDARLVAAMKVHGLSTVLTFDDSGFARYPGIRVLHPAAVAAGVPPETP